MNKDKEKILVVPVNKCMDKKSRVLDLKLTAATLGVLINNGEYPRFEHACIIELVADMTVDMGEYRIYKFKYGGGDYSLITKKLTRHGIATYDLETKTHWISNLESLADVLKEVNRIG